MKFLKTKGIIIKEINVGEADRIVTILTDTKGKIQASARGSKRPRSNLIAGTQFLCYSNLILYKGKSMYNINQSEIIESFYSIRESLESLSYATYFAEVASFVAQENYPNSDLLSLLLNALHLLTIGEKRPEILKIVYELRIMCITGYRPNLISCISCGESSDEIYFNINRGDLTCNKCIGRHKPTGIYKLSPGTMQAMRHIVYSEANKIFSFEVTDKVLKELNTIAKDFLVTHTETDFKSLKFLEVITKDTN